MMFIGSAFGVSNNLENICCMLGAEKVSDHFKFDLKERLPNMLFIAGTLIGGAIAVFLLSDGSLTVEISENTKAHISSLGIPYSEGLLPLTLFNWNALGSISGLLLMVGGGFMVGFGARYAGGCTSGHSISGISNLQASSIISTIFFFIGGLIATHFIYPLIFQP